VFNSYHKEVHMKVRDKSKWRGLATLPDGRAAMLASPWSLSGASALDNAGSTGPCPGLFTDSDRRG
jgi:hypothetical protein